MVTKSKTTTKVTSVDGRRGSMVISPQATLAWSRIPMDSKYEILASFKAATPLADKLVNTDDGVLRVRRIPSGYRVVYESGENHDTIVSVLTPREASLARANPKVKAKS